MTRVGSKYPLVLGAGVGNLSFFITFYFYDLTQIQNFIFPYSCNIMSHDSEFIIGTVHVFFWKKLKWNAYHKTILKAIPSTQNNPLVVLRK